MTSWQEINALDSYFSASPTGPEYVAKLARLLELAGFEKSNESDNYTSYLKKNPASLPETNGIYNLDLSEVAGDALDTPFHLSVEVYPDGNIIVYRLTFEMVFQARNPSKTVKVDMPNCEMDLTRVPELKGNEAIKYLIGLAKQNNLYL